jgi:tetratricopeptide (TPR) repeat protein
MEDGRHGPRARPARPSPEAEGAPGPAQVRLESTDAAVMAWCRLLRFAVLAAALGSVAGADAAPPGSMPSESELKRQEADYYARLRTGPREQELRDLLRRGEFAALEKRLDAVQRDYESGRRPESDVFVAFHPLQRPDAQADLERWVAARPRSWAAVAARGLRLTDAGARARGGKFISETSPMQIAQMEDDFHLALPDLRTAIQARPRFLPAYARLIDIARMDGDDEMARAVFREALKRDPTTLYVRETYLQSLEPRWGGSYAEMESVAREAQAHVSESPRLRSLLGYPVAERAYDRMLAKDWAGAADGLSQALSFGRGVGWLEERARVYQKLGRCQDAITDLDEVLGYEPDAAEALVQRASCSRDLGQRDAAMRDYARAAELAPDSSWVVRSYAQALFRAIRFKESAAVYELYLASHPRDPDALEELAVLYRQSLRNPGRARDLLARVVEIEPRRASAWREYGDALREVHDPRARATYLHYLEIVDLHDPLERALSTYVRQTLLPLLSPVAPAAPAPP